MAQQIINDLSSASNDGNGDTPPVAMGKANANFTELYATIADLQAKVDAIPDNLVEIYWFNASDSTTSTTPISHTGGAAGTWLTNDAAGSLTGSYNPNNKDNIWNPSTNLFDFSSLKIGDTVEIRVDISVDIASANQVIDMFMSLAEGQAFPYSLHFYRSYYKTSATGVPIAFVANINIGNEVTRLGGARFRFASENNASIVVNGWYSKVTSV